MTEQPSTIPKLDPAHLTAEQVEQLRFVLDLLSLHQLIKLAALIKRIEDDPGYGSLWITIERRHLNTIEGGPRDKLPLVLDGEQISRLMGQ